MIRVIKIHKSFRNGKTEKLIVIDIENDVDIDDIVRNWCDQDESGQIYGYNYTWDFVENSDLIMKAVNDELDELKQAIKWRNERAKQLQNFLIKNEGHRCMYSKSLNEPRPRTCAICGKLETI